MDHESPSVTAERETKRQKRSSSSSSQSTVVPSTPPSTSGIVSLKLPSSSAMSTPAQHVGSSQTSNPAEVTMASSTPIDPHNPRGIRSKASLDLLEGDHLTIKTRVEQRWVLPRRLLNSHSPYFASIPSEERAVFLKLSEEEAFELFVQWLYLGELDLDGLNVSSSILVCAWSLGDKFGCPAFKDRVMVQLIKAHSERGIDPRNFRRILKAAKSGSKLHKWVIDQFHSKLTYGYTGYDDRRDGDHPNDKALWKEYATDLKHFGRDFLKVCLDAGEGVDCVKKPWEHGQQYMEVLSYAEIGGCKEEGRSMKVESTLMKAESR